MNNFEERLKDKNIQDALWTLKKLISKHYPHATFEVTQDIDEPDAIDLMAKVDLDDSHKMFDLVLPTVFKFQDKGVPIHVIPL